MQQEESVASFLIPERLYLSLAALIDSTIFWVAWQEALTVMAIDQDSWGVSGLEPVSVH